MPGPTNAVAGRGYLLPVQGFRPAPGDLPNGVILLRSGDTARNLEICRTFVRDLPSEAALRAANPGARIISTYWLLRARPANLRDCGQLLANYDFARAATIRANGFAAATGPVFLGVADNGERVAADLSGVPVARIGQVTRTWFAAAARTNLAAGGLGGGVGPTLSPGQAGPRASRPVLRAWACEIGVTMHSVVGVRLTGAISEVVCRSG